MSFSCNPISQVNLYTLKEVNSKETRDIEFFIKLKEVSFYKDLITLKSEFYTELHHLALLGPTEKFKKKFEEDEQFFSIGVYNESQELIPSPFLLSLHAEDVEMAIYLFDKISTGRKRQHQAFFFIEFLKRNSEKNVNYFWSLLEEDFKYFFIKQFALIMFSSYLEVSVKIKILSCFNTTSIEKQIKLLEKWCVKKEEAVFIRFFPSSAEETQKYVDSENNNWLHKALKSRNYHLMKYLYKRGFDFHKFNNNADFAYLLAFNSGCKIFKKHIKRIESYDQGFYQKMFVCRLMGHYFSLRHSPFFQGIYGFEQTAMTNCLIESVREFKEKNTFDNITNEEIEGALGLFEKSHRYSIKKRKMEEMQAFLLGWHTHNVAIIVFKNYLIKIDTGTIENGGIHFYKIKDPSKEKLERQLARLMNYEIYSEEEVKGHKRFHYKLDKRLNLKHFAWIPFKQYAGNCAWFSRKALFLALLILKKIEKNWGNSKSLTVDLLEKSVEKVAPFFYQWDNYLRVTSLNESIPLLKQYPSLFNMHEIYQEIIRNSLADGKLDALTVIVNTEETLINYQNEDGESLLRLMYKDRQVNLVAHLLLLGADTKLEDRNRNALKDDIEEKCFLPSEISWAEILYKNGLWKEDQKKIFRTLYPFLSSCKQIFFAG